MSTKESLFARPKTPAGGSTVNSSATASTANEVTDSPKVQRDSSHLLVVATLALYALFLAFHYNMLNSISLQFYANNVLRCFCDLCTCVCLCCYREYNGFPYEIMRYVLFVVVLLQC